MILDFSWKFGILVEYFESDVMKNTTDLDFDIKSTREIRAGGFTPRQNEKTTVKGLSVLKSDMSQFSDQIRFLGDNDWNKSFWYSELNFDISHP